MEKITSITKSFSYTYENIFKAKFRNFIKRSVFRYLVACLMLAFSFFVLFHISFVVCFLLAFGFTILLGVTLMMVSSHLIYVKKQNEAFDITFNENQIIISRKPSGDIEHKNWDWIKSVEQINDAYCFNLDIWPPNYIIIKKQELTDCEASAMREWLQLHKKNK